MNQQAKDRKAARNRSRAINRAWMRSGCPPKMIIHTSGSNVYLINGMEVDQQDYEKAEPIPTYPRRKKSRPEPLQTSYGAS